jgi:Winged helix DNA-binding domain
VRERTLTLRELNRTLLARQLLLERRRLPVARALEAVAGLQAQDTLAPLYGLWTRLAGFADAALLVALQRRTVVRATAMRGTVHLLSARDYLRLEPAIAPLVQALWRRYLRDREQVEDVDRLAEEAVALAREPVAATELRKRFGEDAWWRIHRHARFVYAPVPGERSGFGRRALFVSADAWLGRAPVADGALEHLLRRGLRGFGPMTIADLAAWSGLPVAEVRRGIERLSLRRFRDERGRELLDLPRAPLVAGDAPAPPRLLPAFDNTLLAHADRTRVVADEYRRIVIRGGLVDPVVLVDGRVAGRWRIDRGQRATELVLDRFEPVPRRELRLLREEAAALLAFATPDAVKRSVRVQA